jgi:hypothetical protein
MANSPAHKFGQEIGNLLEEVVRPLLLKFANENDYYLDSKGIRGKARPGKKVTWKDKYGNSHDLDFVIEKDGTKDKIGRPLAFIETAWRRYTKHARNKAQEIQSALLPIAEKHSFEAPFLGVILAGVFTEGAITQLESSGFAVLYIKRESIVSTFSEVGISIDFDEQTKDIQFKKCLEKMSALDVAQRKKLIKKLQSKNKLAINAFIGKLSTSLSRYIESILITPLFGTAQSFATRENAVEFLSSKNELHATSEQPLNKIEIALIYSNGDKIFASFKNKIDALAFLREQAI